MLPVQMSNILTVVHLVQCLRSDKRVSGDAKLESVPVLPHHCLNAAKSKTTTTAKRHPEVRRGCLLWEDVLG